MTAACTVVAVKPPVDIVSDQISVITLTETVLVIAVMDIQEKNALMVRVILFIFIALKSNEV